MSNWKLFSELTNGKLPLNVEVDHDISNKFTDMSGITQEELQEYVDNGAQLFAE